MRLVYMQQWLNKVDSRRLIMVVHSIAYNRLAWGSEFPLKCKDIKLCC